MKQKIFVVLFLAAGLVLAVWTGWSNYRYRQQAAQEQARTITFAELAPDPAGGPPQLTSPMAGKPAPNFTLTDLNGRRVALGDLKGKAVVLNFWATWCAPCKIETPWLIDLRNQYAAQGLEVLAVSMDDLDLNDKGKFAQEQQSIARVVAQLHIPYPVLLNGDSISESYGGLDQMPTTFFINRKGVIVAAQIGLSTKNDLEMKMKRALAN